MRITPTGQNSFMVSHKGHCIHIIDKCTILKNTSMSEPYTVSNGDHCLFLNKEDANKVFDKFLNPKSDDRS